MARPFDPLPQWEPAMDDHDPMHLGTEKFAVGQAVARREDPTFLVGRGRYTDDVDLPGQAWAAVVRSPVPHGIIATLDVAPALALPGVLAAFTGRDLVAAGIGDLPCNVALKNFDGSDFVRPPHPPLRLDRVRHVGDPVAIVVAETPEQARDGAEAVLLDIDPLPAVVDVEAAVAEGAPQLWDEAPGNVCLDWRAGQAEATDAAFAAAAHVTRLRIVNNRIVVCAMEPRGAIAEYDAATGRFTLHAGSQGVFGMRGSTARVMGVEPDRVRVRTYEVGGSFGMKAPVYPEYPAILHAARVLGRPVKWTDDRSGSFVSDQQGRDSVVVAELALDADGGFLAARVTGLANMGAYLATVGPNVQTGNIHKNLPSLYRTPSIRVETRCVFTNTTSVSAYRGAGRPEANYYMERLIDTAARETGRDPLELRRRNLIRPEQIPYSAPSGMVYDSGDFPAVLDDCLRLADWDGWVDRKAASEERGLLRGRGLATYLEVTAPPTKEHGGVRFDADGGVTIVTGTLNYGQGHWTPFAQVLNRELGVPFDRIRLEQSDSDRLLAGGGTGGSRSMMASGNAIVQAAARVVEHGRRWAGHLLEAAVEDIEFSDGEFRVAGTDRAIGLLELARRVRLADDRPADLPAGLDVDLVADVGPSAFPNGAHVCEVEIDPETGAVRIDRYVVVDDFGNLVNPMLVEGQVHGGVVQGIGQALMEHCRYDADGQLVTGSFMDYAVPRAADVPSFTFGSHPVPAATNALGVKGCGEAGVSGALASVMNAVNDALAQRGVHHLDMPATPQRVWAALNGAA